MIAHWPWVFSSLILYLLRWGLLLKLVLTDLLVQPSGLLKNPLVSTSQALWLQVGSHASPEFIEVWGFELWLILTLEWEVLYLLSPLSSLLQWLKLLSFFSSSWSRLTDNSHDPHSHHGCGHDWAMTSCLTAQLWTDTNHGHPDTMAIDLTELWHVN